MKITPHKIAKAFRYLKNYGPKRFWIRLLDRMEPEEVPYGPWFANHRALPEQLQKQQAEACTWKNPPRISIVVPVYETPEVFLKELLDSVKNQSYENWQLCIADGSRTDTVEVLIKQYQTQPLRGKAEIRYQHLEENLGIAGNTNAAISLAEGDWIGLLDHDDLLEPDALFEVARAIQEQSTADLIYTDEDKISADSREYYEPHLKPDFNLDLLRSNNYITHFCVVRTEIVKQVGGFRSEYDGAQDYDFIFRCTEAASKIFHIPKILYHWRIHQDSTAGNPKSKQYAFDAGKRAIEGHLERTYCKDLGLTELPQVEMTQNEGFYRVNYPVIGVPLVSIIILNKDHTDMLERCIRSVETSTYTNIEIILVENNSTNPDTFQYYKELERHPKVQLVTWEKEFNYSKLNNFGMEKAKGRYLILLNNDIEIINPSWIEEMLSNCQRQEVGIVGAKLYYPNDTIQHGGIVIGLGAVSGGIAGAVFVDMQRGRDGYLHKVSIQLNYSAVTAACLMVKRSVYEEVGGMEEELAVAFNDVDFCLKVVQKGYLVVYNPWVEAYHYESRTRGKEDTKEKVRRFEAELEYMRKKWRTILKEGDPCYNRNLSLSKTNYSLRGDKQENI